MPRVLVLGREPADVTPAERQAVACAMRARVETLEFVRIDAASVEEHRHEVRVARANELHSVCVLLDTSRQAPIVAGAVSDGAPHFLFAQDKSVDGSSLGNRLFWLTLDGEFQLCRRQHAL